MSVRLGARDVIAEREFDLRSGRKKTTVLVQFGKPRPALDDSDASCCAYRISGLPSVLRTVCAFGVDGVQALHLAMAHAMSQLLGSREYQDGRLTFDGSSELALPVMDPVKHLVRTDPKAEALHAKLDKQWQRVRAKLKAARASSHSPERPARSSRAGSRR